MTDELYFGEKNQQEIVKAHVLSASLAPGGRSTQLLEDEWMGTPDKAIEPPLALDLLSMLSTLNSVRSAAVEAIARNTVGLGYALSIEDAHEEEERDAKETIEQATALLEACAARDTRLEKPSLTELLMAVKTDEEEIGNGYVEVSRNKMTGKVDGLFHAPAKRVRRLKDRSGYVLLDPSGDTAKGRDFYNYGDKIKYGEDGSPTNSLMPDKGWDTNELLSFKLYTSESRDYGLPRDAGMVVEYLGDKLASESNVSFFDSSGTPPTVIFVAGEENNQGGRQTFTVPKETVANIASVMKSDGGHVRRVAVVPLPPGAKAQVEALGQISERDMGFNMFRADNARRCLAAFRLQPIFVPVVSDESKYTAEVQRSITLEQVFDPEQDRYERRLGQNILRDLGFPNLKITFKRLAVENDAAKRDSADKLAEAGSIMRRELRAAHGLSPLPEAAEGATPGPGQVEHGWNDEIVDLGQPHGAEDRVIEGTSQKGQQPGLGGRQQRSGDGEVVRTQRGTPGGASSLKSVK